MLVKCVVCGKEHERPQCNVREFNYCSRKCAETPYWETTCKICGKIYLTTSRNRRSAKWCSTECHNTHIRQTEAHKNGKQVTKICEHCGKEFSVRSSVAKVQKYCSQACSGPAVMGVRTGENNSRWKPKIVKTCPVCGKEFETFPSRAEKYRYCSKECATHKVAVHCAKCGKEFELQPSRARIRVYCSIDCQLTDQATKRYSDQRTSIEITIATLLSDMKINYIEQYPVKWYTCDFYLPQYHAVIECDGDYWHNLPKSLKKDKAKNTFLRRGGYALLRLTETQIHKDADGCRKKIAAMIAKIEKANGQLTLPFD